jgi:uncharacterized protein (DUF362 family)
MGAPVRVAVVRSDNRRGAIAQALALIEDEVRACVAPATLVKPNLVSHRRQLASTHPEALSATLDALLAAGARDITIAEGASDATAGFARFGYPREAWGRPVRFLDLNREEQSWMPLELDVLDGTTRCARVSGTVCTSACRVSLALAKTHVTSMVTFSLKNMLSSLHPDDRILMHGHAGGNGYRGWKRLAVEFLKGDHWLVNRVTRLRGYVARVRAQLGGTAGSPMARLTPKDLAFIKSVATMDRNLVRLTGRVKPHLSIIDAFVAMHGEGPRHGTPFRLGVAIAGTDAVAVDAVAASVMGFDPREVGYLALAEGAGLGTADPDAITILGDPIAAVRRPCVPHSNYALQRHWRLVNEAACPAPHIRLSAREGASRS